MVKYKIETEKGSCICYECNGIYYPLNETDEEFLYESILSIEQINESE